MVNGERVDLTPEEILAREAEEAAWLAEKPTKDWEIRMLDSDVKMSRIVEDIIDALTQAQRDRLSQRTLDIYNEKKTRRAERP